MLIGQLLKPFGYLTIKHPYKWVVDWLYPVLLAILSVVFLLTFHDIRKLIEPNELIPMMLSFVQSLPGFYIAALAAIATFGRADIDDILPEPTPKFVVKLRGHENTIDLTRRRFLAMLFAFLTGESIAIIFYCMALISFGAKIYSYSLTPYLPGPILFGICILVFFIAIYQMILATFWGLYYLGYKLQE
ncbi:hypothetical protein [Pseudomonas helleri]|uniref:hypothetical protein n=1 Tax=Pseudomonas helleri TaxID=1608996 RepID=UPI003FD5D747